MSFESESWSHKQRYGTDYDQDGLPQAEDLCPVCDKVDCNCPPDSSDETPTPQKKITSVEQTTSNAEVKYAE